MSDVLSLTLPNPVTRVRARRKRKPPRNPILAAVIVVVFLVAVSAALDAAASLVLGWYPHAVRKLIVAVLAWKAFHVSRRLRSWHDRVSRTDDMWLVAYLIAVNLDFFLPDSHS